MQLHSTAEFRTILNVIFMHISMTFFVMVSIPFC